MTVHSVQSGIHRTGDGAMMEMICGATRRCLKRRGPFVRFIIVQVALIVVIAVVIIIIQVRSLLVRWQLLQLAGDHRLLTFHSTQYWGIGNSMFAFSSTLAISRSDSSDLHLLVCFDEHLPLRAAFSLLADWPVCNPDDVHELLDSEYLKEEAYARIALSWVVSVTPQPRHWSVTVGSGHTAADGGGEEEWWLPAQRAHARDAQTSILTAATFIAVHSGGARYDRQLVHNLPRDRHIVLDRFLQSWRYFADIDAELRRLFRFDKSVWEAASSALKRAIGDSVDDILKIGLHVRRGDIVQQESLIRRGYVSADISYIERAMDYMDRHLHVDSNTGLDQSGRRRVFIICSDDPFWCLENLPTSLLRRSEFMSTEDPIVDLAILAMCQHTIVTVGTFGWWAAWLANGTTVYYKDWPYPGSQLAAATSHADYFPPHWIPL